MTCPICRRHRLVEIRVDLGDAEVTLHSCSACDARWWDRDGEPLSLADVLALTAEHA